MMAARNVSKKNGKTSLLQYMKAPNDQYDGNQAAKMHVKNAMEDGNEIIMPPSINMEAQLFDENESERNDYVKSLSLQSIVDILKNNQ
jgi:hypothetical protein